mgnify:CR=1 FL=1
MHTPLHAHPICMHPLSTHPSPPHPPARTPVSPPSHSPTPTPTPATETLPTHPHPHPSQGCYECIICWVEERGTCPVCKQPDLAPNRLFEVEPPPVLSPARPDEHANGTHATSTHATDGWGHGQGMPDVAAEGSSLGSSSSAAAAAASSAASSASASASASAGPSSSSAAPSSSSAFARLSEKHMDQTEVREFGSKVATLLAVAREARAQGERVVVFSSWTRLLTLASDALTSRGLPCASLVGSAADKQAALQRFGALQPSGAVGGEEHTAAAAAADGSDGSCHVLLVPLFGGASGAGASGAAGLNLQVASVAVLLEPSLQPAIEQQVRHRRRDRSRLECTSM